MAGEGLPLVGGILGHRRHRTNAGYAHLAGRHLVEVAEKVGGLIAGAVDLAVAPLAGNTRGRINSDGSNRGTPVTGMAGPGGSAPALAHGPAGHGLWSGVYLPASGERTRRKPRFEVALPPADGALPDPVR